MLLCDVIAGGVGRRVMDDAVLGTMLDTEEEGTGGLRIDESIEVDGEGSCCVELLVVATSSLDGIVDSSCISIASADDCD